MKITKRLSDCLTHDYKHPQKGCRCDACEKLRGKLFFHNQWWSLAEVKRMIEELRKKVMALKKSS